MCHTLDKWHLTWSVRKWENNLLLSAGSAGPGSTHGTHQTCQVLTHFLKDKSCWRWTVDDCVCLGLFYLRPVSLMSWYYTFLCVQAGHKSVHVCPFVYPGQHHTWAACPPVFIIIGGNFEKSTWISNVHWCWTVISPAPVLSPSPDVTICRFLTIIYFRIHVCAGHNTHFKSSWKSLMT